MDLSTATEQISDVVSNTKKYKSKTEEVYNKYAKLINGHIDDLEKIVNDSYMTGVTGVIWVEMQINKLFNNIKSLLDSLNEQLTNITNNAKEWYTDSVNNIKISVIKSCYAKVGKEYTDEELKLLADSIPSPSFESLVPAIKVELQVPEVTDINSIDTLKLKKLPLI